MFDIERAVEVLAHIEMHPEQHDQSIWIYESHEGACGTTACFAGWTVLLAEVKVQFSLTYGGYLCANGKTVHEVARDLLGLSSEQAYNLFYCDTLDHLYSALAEYAGLSEEVLRKEVRKVVER